MICRKLAEMWLWRLAADGCPGVSPGPLKCARRDASTTLWRETRQLLSNLGISTNSYVRQYTSRRAFAKEHGGNGPEEDFEIQP